MHPYTTPVSGDHHYYEEQDMSTYVLLTKLTEKGYETMHHNPDRLDAVAGEIQ